MWENKGFGELLADPFDSRQVLLKKSKKEETRNS